MKKFILLLSAVFVSVSCSEKVEIDPKFAFTTMVKRASMEKNYPNGFFLMGFMAEKNHRGLLTGKKAGKYIKQIEALYPNGKIVNIRPRAEYGEDKGNIWNGYLLVGKEHLQTLWLASDMNHHNAKMPPMGTYTFKVTAADGAISSTQSTFEPKNDDPVQGYPTEIRFNADSRTIRWKGTTGQMSYRLYVFEGKMGEMEDWSKMVYDTTSVLIPDTSHKLPEKVELEKGKSYYILAEAYNPPYFHLQDKKGEIAEFKLD
jgi:hypothetical protein